MVKHRYGPTRRGIFRRVAVALNEDADSVVDEVVDADADAGAAQPEPPETMQRLRSDLRYYKLEQTVVSRLREPGKVVYAVLRGDLSKWKCAVRQSTSTVARGDPVEG